jgi:general nucleoside transport system permease protein
MVETLIEQTLNLTIIAIILRMTVPILLAALGGLLTELAGVVNIGLEGQMLIAAFTSIVAADTTGNWIIGVLAGIAATSLISLLMGFFSLNLEVDIIITGFVVNIFGSGITVFLMGMLFGTTGNYSPKNLNKIPVVNIPFLDNVPVLGKLLNNHSLFVWISLFAVVFVFYLLYRTPYGYHLRAVGEEPDAAKSLGISVMKIKYSALLWSGVFTGLAGAYFSMGMTNMFVKDMTAGTGFLALAVVMFGNRNPIGILIGSLLFGLASAIAIIVETIPESPVPSQFIKMIPYLVTVIALIVYAVRNKRKLISINN